MKIKYYSVVFFGFFIIFSLFHFLHQTILQEMTTEVGIQKNYEIHMDMPKGNHKKLIEIISAEIDFRKQEFLNEIKEAPDDHNFSFDVTFLHEAFSKYISYVFFIETYLGGAHPNTEIWTIVYDVETKEVVTLDYLVKENPDFLTQVANDVQSTFLIDPRITDITWMMEGTRAVKENYQNFIFTEKGIIFYFPPYQIAPYSNGILTSSVDYKKEWKF